MYASSILRTLKSEQPQFVALFDVKPRGNLSSEVSQHGTKLEAFRDQPLVLRLLSAPPGD
jgi:hypothetical protein